MAKQPKSGTSHGRKASTRKADVTKGKNAQTVWCIRVAPHSGAHTKCFKHHTPQTVTAGRLFAQIANAMAANDPFEATGENGEGYMLLTFDGCAIDVLTWDEFVKEEAQLAAQQAAQQTQARLG